MTVASFLKENNYSTAAIGKWHLGFNWVLEDGDYFKDVYDKKGWNVPGFEVDYSKRITGGPIDLGFEYFYGISASLDMPPYCFIENDRVVKILD